MSFILTAGNAVGYIHISLTAYVEISIFDLMVKTVQSCLTPKWVSLIAQHQPGFTKAIVLISVPAVQQLIDLRADLMLPNKL